MGSNLSL